MNRRLRFRLPCLVPVEMECREPPVDSQRKMILIGGPIILIAACLILTLSSARDSQSAASAPQPLQVDVVSPLRNDSDSRLRQSCENVAQEMIAQLDDGHAVLIRPPYVLAGDMSEGVLERLHREVVLPTERALKVAFFDAEPTEPITIVAFAKEPGFREFARRVDRRGADSYYGYYLRNHRRLVVNLATGAGTLAHELTHALAHFDFPNMPEWFDEGLASVFEQSEFKEAGHRLSGTDNWRVHQVLRAIHDNQLRSTGDLVQGRSVRANNEAIDYAHSRYICLFLQEQQLLEPFYRKLRSRSEIDPTGWETLCEVLARDTTKAVDTDFKRWVVQFHKSQRQRAASLNRHTLSMRPVERSTTDAIASDVTER